MLYKSSEDLRKYCYFSSLSNGALEALSNKLHTVELPAGTEIIKENTPADAFYLVSNGEVDVLKKSNSGKTEKISVAGQGEGFGEMALLTCSPRYCSVIAKTDVTLLKLNKSDFEEIVRMDSAFSRMVEHKIQTYSQFKHLKELKPFTLLQPEKISLLTNKLKEKKYAPGQNIITQGEEGDLYYIIRSGKVAVLKKTSSDEPEHIATMGEGHGFGEEALITDSPRNATVRAVDETVVWTLSRSDFNSIMKSALLKEIFQEDVQAPGKDHVFIDVRMKTEFNEEHIPDAVNIPLDELRQRYSELAPERKYYVYCLAGARSASAAFLLRSQGFDAKSIRGGLNIWTGPLTEGHDGVHTPFKPT